MKKYVLAACLSLASFAAQAGDPITLYLDSDGGLCDGYGKHFTSLNEYEIYISLSGNLKFPGDDFFEQSRFFGIQESVEVTDEGVMKFKFARKLYEREDGYIYNIVYYPTEGVLDINGSRLDAKPCLPNDSGVDINY